MVSVAVVVVVGGVSVGLSTGGWSGETGESSEGLMLSESLSKWIEGVSDHELGRWSSSSSAMCLARSLKACDEGVSS